MKRKNWEVYIGEIYNNVMVISTFEKYNGKRNIRYFECKCLRCGNIFVSTAHDILRKDKRSIKSCGCWQKEVASEIGKVTGPINIKYSFDKKYRKYKHCSCDGHGKQIPLYINYRCMMSRCYNPNDICYNLYGEKGIDVFEEWLNFDDYFEWAMENGYVDGYESHRLNNDIGYYPDNVIYLPDQFHNAITLYMKRNKLSSMTKEEVYQYISEISG